MSAYGTIPRPSGAVATLFPLTYPVLAPGAEQKPASFVTVVPVKRASIPDGLFDHLHDLFNAVVQEGRTYPQEFVLTEQSFAEYYFGYDCFIAVLDKNFVPTRGSGSWDPKAEAWVRRDVETIEEVLGTGVTEYKEHVVGMYYVKPNYPGRSSHCCNGGFIVDPYHRGAGYGNILGRSYLQFAPQLGYLASVFNLVYANNQASLKIWDKLGFTRAGLIPRAGRLRTKGGKAGEEEWVDAVVFWKSLVEDAAWEKRVTSVEGLHEV